MIKDYLFAENKQTNNNNNKKKQPSEWKGKSQSILEIPNFYI